MEERARLLVGDDDQTVRDTVTELLSRAGHDVDTAEDGDELLERIRANRYDLVLCDLHCPPTGGIRVLREIKRSTPRTLVAISSGRPGVENVLEAFRSGAYDVLLKPLDPEKLLELATRSVEIRDMGQRRQSLAEELETERLRVLKLRQQIAADDPFQRLIGHSSTMQALVDTLREVARTDCTVLLTGESGTGKGLVARTLHESSVRSSGPFVEANCVVYAEGVLHSELFGHERGAFTGAARSKKGRFELARGGTLFLDEIGEISAATQLLLLRVLQERTFERVGGEETIDADVRLIAATNRDLPDAVRQGSFRSDLFYRLNVIPVQMPPLRERSDDIPLLIEHFLERNAVQTGREVEGITPEAIRALVRYPWPGNIRELENMIERLVVLNQSRTIGFSDLPPAIREAADRQATVDVPGTLQDLERGRIIEALRETIGNKKRAAERLGIHRSTLYAKMRRYGLLDDDGRMSEECSDSGHRASGPATSSSTS